MQNLAFILILSVELRLSCPSQSLNRTRCLSRSLDLFKYKLFVQVPQGKSLSFHTQNVTTNFLTAFSSQFYWLYFYVFKLQITRWQMNVFLLAFVDYCIVLWVFKHIPGHGMFSKISLISLFNLKIPFYFFGTLVHQSICCQELFLSIVCIWNKVEGKFLLIILPGPKTLWMGVCVTLLVEDVPV